MLLIQDKILKAGDFHAGAVSGCTPAQEGGPWMGIVSLKHDYCFKNLMTNEEVRRHFISDVLGIPLEEIKSVRLSSTFLWKRYRLQKQGILDVLLALNDDSKVNVELQIKILKYWDRRSLFYLAKMFTEDLLIGERYTKLKKCISISILDFSLDAGAKYHKIYRLRDEEGKEFSDLFEIHIIELQKELKGGDQVDDWIRLINAETEEDLEMIKTDNPGILAAIREVKVMSLGRGLRALYEAHMKEVRDRNARDDYVRDEGIAIGETKKLIHQVRKKAAKHMSAEAIADMLEEEVSLVARIYELVDTHPDWDDERIYHNL